MWNHRLTPGSGSSAPFTIGHLIIIVVCIGGMLLLATIW